MILQTILLITGITVYATTYRASDISYTNNRNVANALDDLYSKVPNGTIPITTKGNQINVSAYQYADTSGMYTAGEYNAKTGEETYWNSGDITSSSGINTINVKFVPKKIAIVRSDGVALIYDYDKDPDHVYSCLKSGVYEEELNSSNTSMACIRTIGSNVTFYTSSSLTWYWFATQ